MTEQYQFPETIDAGVAKFGGILAAVRALMIVMFWINRRQFERKVSKFMHKEKAKAEDIQESSASDAISHAGDIYRRRKFSIQDEDVNVSNTLLS